MKRNFFFVVLAEALIAIALTVPSFASVTPIDFTGFTGSGFSPTPDPGQLDSDLWRVTGLSDGDGTFGGTYVTGDFARGTNPGTGTTGGVYGFINVGSTGNTVLGVRPGETDFTPGDFTLKVVNSTGGTIANAYIVYTIWVRNDQDRAGSLNFSYSLNDSDYVAVTSLDYTSEAAKDGSPTWVSVSRSTTLTNVNLANDDVIYFKWTVNDVSGTGSRDAFGLDDVEVRVTGPTAVTLRTLTATAPFNPLTVALPALGLVAAGGIGAWRRRRG